MLFEKALSEWNGMLTASVLPKKELFYLKRKLKVSQEPKIP
jgi:hypothetical protein